MFLVAGLSPTRTLCLSIRAWAYPCLTEQHEISACRPSDSPRYAHAGWDELLPLTEVVLRPEWPMLFVVINTLDKQPYGTMNARLSSRGIISGRGYRFQDSVGLPQGFKRPRVSFAVDRGYGMPPFIELDIRPRKLQS